MTQSVRQGFARTARAAGASPAQAEAAFADLVARHAEPHRRYHTLHHVLAVLEACDGLRSLGAPCRDERAVDLAAWYHDAVYDPREDDNEEASARLAVEALSGWGRASQAKSAAVDRLILATKAHEPQDDDEALLVDADLAVLAGPPTDYAAYAAAIRAEYDFLDGDAWRRGRAAFLNGMLARERLFHTAPDRSGREARARTNLSAERARLDAASWKGPG